MSRTSSTQNQATAITNAIQGESANSSSMYGLVSDDIARTSLHGPDSRVTWSLSAAGPTGNGVFPPSSRDSRERSEPDLEDLEAEKALGSLDLDHVADSSADQGGADRRQVTNASRGRVGLAGSNDPVVG